MRLTPLPPPPRDANFSKTKRINKWNSVIKMISDRTTIVETLVAEFKKRPQKIILKIQNAFDDIEWQTLTKSIITKLNFFKKLLIPLPTLHAQLKHTVFYHYLFGMFYWSAAVAYIVIHLNIFIFEIDFFMNENGFLTHIRPWAF